MARASSSPARTSRASGRRAKKLFLALGSSRRYTISLRYFRTRPETRSQKQKQLVWRLYGLPIREVAITTSRHKKPRKTRAQSAAHHNKLSRFALPIAPMLLGLTGAVYFSLNLHQAVKLDVVLKHPAVAIAEPATSKSMASSTPVHLTIPSIGVNTDLTTMGVGANGTIQMPIRYDIEAWYTGSPTHGAIGQSVIAGHVDSQHGIGVFWRLRELQPGSEVDVTRADGSTAEFKIITVEQYNKASFPTEKVYGAIQYAGLRLITCGGFFDNQVHDYPDNIVAYGVLE